MVSIQGFKRPLDGSGTLFYFPSEPGDVRNPPLVFRFVSRRGWAGDRPAPFAWRLIEPVGDLKHPVLDLVADRFTEIIPPPAYNKNRGPDPSLATPFVRLFRPQIPHGVPQEEMPFDADEILGNADQVFGTTERTRRVGGFADPSLHRFYIHHLPVSNQGELCGKPICLITNIVGNYQLQLRPKNIWKPIAYWVQIFDSEEVVNRHTALMWAYVDRNIDLTNLIYSEASVGLRVYRRFLASSNEREVIPEFANNVSTSQGGWPAKWDWVLTSQEEVLIRSERPEGYWWRQFVQKTEDLIGVIPIAGDVYDIGSIAYMSATGKAPWTGDRVPRGVAIMYGVAVLGPMSVSRLRRLEGFTRNLPRDLAKLSDDALQEGLERALAPEYALPRRCRRLHERCEIAAREWRNRFSHRCQYRGNRTLRGHLPRI